MCAESMYGSHRLSLPGKGVGSHIRIRDIVAVEVGPAVETPVPYRCQVVRWHFIAQAVTLISPEVVVVGGGVSLAGKDLFFEPAWAVGALLSAAVVVVGLTATSDRRWMSTAWALVGGGGYLISFFLIARAAGLRFVAAQGTVSGRGPEAATYMFQL